MSEYDRELKYRVVLKGLGKLGLEVKSGSKHMTATCPATQNKTTVPRHTIIGKKTIKSICEFLEKNGYDKDDIRKAFKL